jgi:HSP20 family protein
MSSLMRWDPFRGLMRMQTDLDRLFEEFFGRPMLSPEREGVRLPSVDVSETDTEVVVKAELPGVSRDNIEVEVRPESISIAAEMSKEEEQKEQTWHRRERVWGRYERVIPLPAEVITDQAKAKLKDGVLEVRMTKTERAKASTARKVKIE